MRKHNGILLLANSPDDYRVIAMAVNGIKNVETPFNFSKPKNEFFKETDRHWVYTQTLIPGYKEKHDTVITVSVAGKTYDSAYHGWLLLMEQIDEY